MYEIELNHRRLLDGMLEICGVPPEKFTPACSSIRKLDKLTFADMKKKELVCSMYTSKLHFSVLFTACICSL